MNPRPTSVTVMAVLGFIFAAFTILATLIGWLFHFGHITFGARNPAMEALQAKPLYIIGIVVGGIINLGLSAVLIWASAASLKLHPRGRRGLLGWAIADLVVLVVSTIYNAAYVMPVALTMPAGPGMPPPGSPAYHTIQTFMVIGGIMGGCFGLLFAAALPVCVLIFFNRPVVKDAFNGIFHAPRGNFPVEFPSQ